jgi:ribosome-binding factor A
MKTHRTARVAEVIREVAAATILFHIRDPRVKNVTVLRAEVSGDLQHGKVFVSVLGTDKEQAQALNGLRSAAGFIQGKVGDRLATRFTPTLTFVLDQGVKRSVEIARILREEQALSQPPADPPVDDVDAEASDTDVEKPAPDAPTSAGR